MYQKSLCKRMAPISEVLSYKGLMDSSDDILASLGLNGLEAAS